MWDKPSVCVGHVNSGRRKSHLFDLNATFATLLLSECIKTKRKLSCFLAWQQ